MVGEKKVDLKKDEKKIEDVDCKCYADQRGQGGSCPRIQNVTHPLRYYEFTQEEMKALEECDKESFYQRCLPFSTVLAAATYVAVKNGVVSRHVHWGATPKVAAAVLVGHFLGRVSSVPSCAHRLRELPPSSYLGTVMRKHYADARKLPPEPNKK